MRYSTTFTDKTQVFVVLGDGPFDEKLLRGLAPKFNGERKSLAVTPPPNGRITTLAALEQLATTLDDGLNIEQALFIVDREHAQNLAKVTQKLHAYGFAVNSQEDIVPSKATILKIKRGPHVIKLYAVIAGNSKCIDEEVADLASAINRKHVTPAKAKKLREIELKELIDRSPKDVVKSKIPGLTTILEIIEQDC